MKIMPLLTQNQQSTTYLCHNWNFKLTLYAISKSFIKKSQILTSMRIYASMRNAQPNLWIPIAFFQVSRSTDFILLLTAYVFGLICTDLFTTESCRGWRLWTRVAVCMAFYDTLVFLLSKIVQCLISDDAPPFGRFFHPALILIYRLRHNTPLDYNIPFS